MERYRSVTEKAMPRLLDRNRLKQPLEISIDELTAASVASDEELDDILGERAEAWQDRTADASYLARIDAGVLPRNIEGLPEHTANRLIDEEAKQGNIYWTFTPSIQSIEAEVKRRARRALMVRGIYVSEKTIGRVWKRDYWPQD